MSITLLFLRLTSCTGRANANPIAFCNCCIQDCTNRDGYFHARLNCSIYSIPSEIHLYEFYINGKQFPAQDFAAGLLHMDGTTALGYAKAMPKGEYSPTTERVLHSQAVFDAILTKLSKHRTLLESVTVGSKLAAFLSNEQNIAAVEADFDLGIMLNSNIKNVAGNLVQVLLKYGPNLGVPKAGEGIYLAADFQGGGGGVRIPRGDMLVPIDANPNGDPVKDYWKSVRNFVRGRLAR